MNMKEPVLDRIAAASERCNTTPPQLMDFIRFCERRTAQTFTSYFEFERWSIDEFRAFWSLLLDWCELPASGSREPVCEGDLCETAKFFPHVELNYAEALLTGWDMDALAVSACHPHRRDEHITRSDLYRKVTRLAKALRRLGVIQGDRVVAIARNSSEAVVAALAAAAIGAVFSSCAPDMGTHAILSRFEPLEPKLLLANVKQESWDSGAPVRDRVAEVASGLSSLTHLIVLDGGEPPHVAIPALSYVALISEEDDAEFEWERFPFNHPLFIMFSSGTTGPPKCIVHGAGGTLLEHLKEHRLHCDLGPPDRLYFHTSCAWMMWNWQLSALASGAEIVLFDGPVRGPETLWELVDRHEITVFGTSPAYLQLCETAPYSPRTKLSLNCLRSILSTGSILYERQFDWVRDHVKAVPLQSISGGTDIIGCFVLGNPLLPVHRGEAQSRSLALDVRSLSEPGASGTIGELVCANPFPSRPMGLFGDADRSQFHASYFSKNPPFWTHGDLIEFTPHGGARLHGRSDGVLNVRGIRVGPAEIYGILHAMDEIVDAIAVEQQAQNAPGDARLILLVVLQEGLTLTPELAKVIRLRLAKEGSTALVPARCVQVPELPTTFSGKRSEAAARDVVNEREARNVSALRNPGSLEAIRTALTTSGEADDNEALPVRSREDVQTEAELREALQQIVSRQIGFAISPDDNFLELGADSLSMLMLLMEIEEFAGHELPFDAFLSAPTVEGLSRLIWGQAEREHSDGRTDKPTVRPATRDDIEPICQLLDEGFDNDQVAPGDWRQLFSYDWIDDKPKLGFVLTLGPQIVGFLGTIYSQRLLGGREMALVCNLSSWYVRPEYRGWGSFLLAAALKDKSTTYTALTPGPETRAMLDGLGFARLEKRRFFFPLLNLGTLTRSRLHFEYDHRRLRSLLSDTDRPIFDDHGSFDLLHLVVRDHKDYAYLVVKRRVIRAKGLIGIPVSELLYCSDPTFLVAHFERIKLAVLKRQRAVLFVAHERFVPATVQSLRKARFDRYRSSPIYTESDLDLLYSELVLLPI